MFFHFFLMLILAICQKKLTKLFKTLLILRN